MPSLMPRTPGSVTPIRTADGTIRYRARLPIAGKRRSLGIYGTESEAWDVINATLDQLGDNAAGLTLAVWAERWQARRETDGLHRATVTTASIIRARITKAPFAHFPMRRITRQHVVKWIRRMLREPPSAGHRHRTQPERRTSRQTVVNTLNVLRTMLRDAADEGHLGDNPADGVRVPKVPTTSTGWTYLETDEIAAIEALPVADDGKRPRGHISAAQRSVLLVAAYTGLRQGELWGLRWGDVHLDGDRPRFVVRYSYRGPTKGGRVREVPLLPQARRELAAWKALHPGIGAAWVWPSRAPRGSPPGSGGCHCKGYDAQWPRVRRLAAIRDEVRFHDLRHTCASHLVMGTWTPEPLPLVLVRDWLGHRSITTTERYAHLAPGAVHDAVRVPRGKEREG